MDKICPYCNQKFVDHTKNHNKKICGSKECVLARGRAYISADGPEKRKYYAKLFLQANPNYRQQYRERNLPFVRKLNREYVKNRDNSDIVFRLKRRLRNRLYLLGSNKVCSAIDELGCSVEALKIHLERQFKPGMSWDNYGKWHIDHKIPLSSAASEDEVKRLCHYTNLQPLWAEENLRKSDKNVSL